MKKQNNQIIQFYKSYISQYTSAFSTKQLQKISNIQKIIEKKIKEKNSYSYVEMVARPQLQTIFYATLTRCKRNIKI